MKICFRKFFRFEKIEKAENPSPIKIVGSRLHTSELQGKAEARPAIFPNSLRGMSCVVSGFLKPMFYHDIMFFQ